MFFDRAIQTQLFWEGKMRVFLLHFFCLFEKMHVLLKI